MTAPAIVTPTFAVATPSRGDVQSRTIESVLAAVADVENSGLGRRVDGQWWFLTHDLPIPDAHEAAVEGAMSTGADCVWIVESDNLPPVDALTASFRHLLKGFAGLVAVAYPVGEPPPAGNGTRWDTIYRENGEILFTGLGVTLIRRAVLEALDRPWFRIDRRMVRRGTKVDLVPSRPQPNGQVDVVFGLRVRKAGWKLDAVPDMVAGHVRTLKQGQRPANNSPNRSEIWDSIDRPQELFNGLNASRFAPNYAQDFAALAPWVTRFQIAGRWYGGKFDAVNDPRVALCREVFPDAKSVLELGSLECGHTVALAKWAEKVLAIEGRRENLERGRYALDALEVTNAELIQGNLEEMDLPEGFDLVYCVGLLYHLPNPIRLIYEMARVSPNLFLWTHHGGDEDREYREFGLEDSLSGLSPTSKWLSRADLLAELRNRYASVDVLDEEADHHGAGPAITIAASR